MQSIVAGVTEEAAFRGYMQSIIERRYGIVMAILVNGIAVLTVWAYRKVHALRATTRVSQLPIIASA